MRDLTCGEAQLLSASWALGSIDKDEEFSLRRHLDSCLTCQRAESADSDAAAMLATSVPQVTPPAALKGRLFRLIDTLERERVSRPSTLLPPRRPRRPFVFRPAFAAALGALALVGILGGWGMMVQNRLANVEQLHKELSVVTTRLDDSNQNRVRLMETSARLNLLEEKHLRLADGLRDQRLALYVASLPASVAKTLDPTSPRSRGWGMFLGSPNGNVAIMLAVGLQQLPEGKVYQVWLTDEFGYHNNAGTFTVDNDGFGQLFMRMFRTISYFKKMGVSIEPEGGSAHPTTGFVLGGDI